MVAESALANLSVTLESFEVIKSLDGGRVVTKVIGPLKLGVKVYGSLSAQTWGCRRQISGVGAVSREKPRLLREITGL